MSEPPPPPPSSTPRALPAAPGAGDASLTTRAVAAIGAVAIVAVAALAVSRLWFPLVFALWTAALLDPLAGVVALVARGRRVVGAAAGVLLVLSLLIPVGLLLASLAADVAAFARAVAASPAAREAFETFVAPAARGADAGSAPPPPLWLDGSRWVEFAQAHGATAWRALREFAGAGATVVLGAFVFFVALYTFLLDGRAMWGWVEAHAPVSRATSRRLAAAFLETGRGLVVGAGLTALVQSVLAAGLYLALGVPRVGVLAALTFACAFVPAIGTAIVWGPVALGFALTGQVGKALIMVAAGALGISTIDNVIRPVLQRWGGQLNLPAFVLLLAAFGGLAAFGPGGLVLGPLSLRMAREVLELAREARARNDDDDDDDVASKPARA